MNKIYNKKYECVVRKSGDEYILVPVTDDIATMKHIYALNEIGMFIWERIDGKTPVNEIAEQIISDYETDKETAIRDVQAFIKKMAPIIEEIFEN